MDRQAIYQTISQQFSSMNLQFKTGTGADFVVNMEFLDAGFSTGDKKITYEASIYLEEASRTAYMWEKTSEVGHGFSFGSDSGSYVQSGTTLFRKVKSIQYAPDGKAYEYTLNIGAIAKAVKTAAKTYGWKFKTVLKRDKAQYPAGYLPIGFETNTYQASAPEQSKAFCRNCGMLLNAGSTLCGKCGLPVVQGNPPVKSIKNNKKKPLINMLWFILALVTFFFFWLADVSVLGMVMTGVVFLALLLLSNKFLKRGCFPVIFLWIISIIALIFIFVYMVDETETDTGGNGKKEAASDTGVVADTKENQEQEAAKFNLDVANTRGNTNGNIINDGYATIQDENIFILANSSLYIMKNDKNNMELSTIFTDIYAHDLNVLGSFAYYVDNSGNLAKADITTGDIQVMEGVTEVSNVFVTTDKIYFLSGTYPCSMDLDGNNLRTLYEGYAQSLNLSGDYLYYQDNYSMTVAVKQRTDGTGRTAFTPDLLNYSMYLVSEGSSIYYSDNNSRNICRVKDDGTDRVKLSDDQTLLLNVSGDYIYYANESDGNKVYRIKTDGTDRQKVCDVAAGYISVAGDFIVITTEENNAVATYIVGTDGSNLQKLE